CKSAKEKRRNLERWRRTWSQGTPTADPISIRAATARGFASSLAHAYDKRTGPPTGAVVMTPENLRYTRTHEWAKFEGDLVTMGVTKFAADLLTDVTYLELPHVGDHVFANQECGSVETVKSVNPLYSPVEGEVVAVNDKLIEEPNDLTKDPYGAGWMIK